ncbi:DUF1127 domain-containing protein [Devosia algicola]|uniref:DUF1127 domain-containing protein n=1 Tax=Devosia algicola TaxID=3026418 RepID=A0ABY7YLD2_9HYPH|nr:DUF1127 domain-containing protein [Devosia algicola]WDR01770.1 DUF1127 domain-containing protein [Devosia algicola]
MSFTRIMANYALHRRRRLAALELSDLSERQLRDIGLTRYDIRAAMQRR